MGVGHGLESSDAVLVGVGGEEGGQVHIQGDYSFTCIVLCLALETIHGRRIK